MPVDRMLKITGLLVVTALVCGCSAVESVHTYFNSSDGKSDKQNEIENSTESVVYKVKAPKERLSDISFKLTGNRDTAAIRKANPAINSDIVLKGEEVRIPINLLKSTFKSPPKQTVKDPVAAGAQGAKKQQGKPAKPAKQIKKIQLPEDIEILPGDETPQENTSGVKDNYYDTPFKNDDADIVPFEKPKPPVNNQELEEKKLRDKYKDIMDQLD